MGDIDLGGTSQPGWRTYEDVARILLDLFREDIGADAVEGRQSVPHLYAETTYEIDGRAVIPDGGFLIVECRRQTTSGVTQEAMGGIVYRVRSTGATGGVLVSPLPPQEGAGAIAEAENIRVVELSADSTPDRFAIKIGRHARIGVEGVRGCGAVGRVSVQITNSHATEGHP